MSTKTVPKEKETSISEMKEPSRNVASVDNFIAKAIETNADVQTLERLFALHKEVKAEQARSAFVQALANFQKECPSIEKTKKVTNKDGTLRYTFAPLDGIAEQIKDTLANNGFSYSWDVDQPENMMKVTATLTHIEGHAETSTLAIPIVSDGYMTEPQKYASAQTYAKRYTLLNVLGISTADEDTDATDVGDEKDAKSVKAQIVLYLRRLGYETEEKSVIEETVKKVTNLKLTEKNYEEIAGRLSVLVKEKEEYESSNIQ